MKSMSSYINNTVFADNRNLPYLMSQKPFPFYLGCSFLATTFKYRPTLSLSLMFFKEESFFILVDLHVPYAFIGSIVFL